MEVKNLEDYRAVLNKLLKERGLKDTQSSRSKLVREFMDEPEKSDEHRAMHQFMLGGK